MSFQTFLTKGLIIAMLIFVAAAVFGVGGGAVAIFSFAGSLAKMFTVLPWWLNVVVGISILWIFFGRK